MAPNVPLKTIRSARPCHRPYNFRGAHIQRRPSKLSGGTEWAIRIYAHFNIYASHRTVFKNQLETHFAAKHRADDVEAYLSAMRFDCDFPKGDWIVSRLGDLKGGAVLMCSYRFDGSFYLLPDNMIVSVYFDSNLQSVRFEQIVEVV